MKLVPCPRCKKVAVGQKTPGFPDGAPVVFGRYTGGPGPVVVKCHRCTLSFRVGPVEFAGLPTATPEELKTWGLDKVV